MHVTSLFAALAGVLGAVIAGLFLPGRREFARLHGPPGTPVAAPAGHQPKHASTD
jgi:hypothetical protein